MLIKCADDQSRRVTFLDALLASSYLDYHQKDWIRKELKLLTRGMQGERDAAHYLDNYLKDSPNHGLIHDLRLVIDGETAQIDHLIVDRAFDFYLLETKNYAGNLTINEQGEFSVKYAGDVEYGIPSPIEQSRRHERILLKALKQCGISGRVTARPRLHHVILVHPKATIRRPRSREFDTTMVIKADQFRAWHEKQIEQEYSPVTAFVGLLNVRSSGTVESWAKDLCRLHTPTNPLKLPEFLVAKKSSSVASPAKPSAQAPAPAEVAASASAAHPLYRKLVCATCGKKLTQAVGSFCWNKEQRFGGLQYCLDHQQAFA